jgi:VanZ family protein
MKQIEKLTDETAGQVERDYVSRTIHSSQIAASNGHLRWLRMSLLVLSYAGLIGYGSLYPFGPLVEPAEPLFSFLLLKWPYPLSRADLVQNVLIYAPLGLLIAVWLSTRLRFRSALLVATLAGTGLSLTMESIQQFLPGRVASIVDLLMNAGGTLLGGLVATLLTRQTLSGAKLLRLKDTWFRAGPLPNLGLTILGLWALSQTSPLVPSLDVGHLREGLSPLKYSLLNPQDISIAKTTTYTLYIAGLGLLASTLGQRGKRVIMLYFAFLGLVLACKVLVVGRQLSLEAVIGALAAIILIASVLNVTPRAVAVAGTVCVTVGFTIYELSPGQALFFYSFNWIPFVGQMSSISGLGNILEIIWPFMAIAYFTRYAMPTYLQTAGAVFGGIIILHALLFMEWYQQYLPGRFGDITQVLLGLSAWILPWCIGGDDYSAQCPREDSPI